MPIDLPMTLGGFLVGIVVGLTGMGGGALMTPMLMVVFGVPPLAAVSSDLAASAVMKPVGAVVHLRRGTVHRRLVTWLSIGSVPSAFCGVLITRALGDDDTVQDVVRLAMGIALLFAVTMMVIKAYLGLVTRARRRSGRESARPGRESARPGRDAVTAGADFFVRPIPTVLVGIVGGVIVGMTSVGSGSLIIVALLVLYPRLAASELVGTDLVQAVPLVLSAALGHLVFGDFHPGVTVSLLIGSIPGTYLGARLSSRAPGGLIRRVLLVVLLASGLKMLGLGTTALITATAAAVLGGPLLWMLARRRHGMPAVARTERRRPSADAEHHPT